MSDPNPTPAQEEFRKLVAGSSSRRERSRHSEDSHDRGSDRSDKDEGSEEEAYLNSRIDAAMRMPTFDRDPAAMAAMKLPPASFDAGRTTGVKGVIADARSYQAARRTKFMTKVHTARRSIFGLDGDGRGGGGGRSHSGSSSGDSMAASADDGEQVPLGCNSNNGSSGVADEAAFLEQWRESRRRELESDASKGQIKNRRTSPSVRMYGRMDHVDALGYLDAIEKVRRETMVVVFVTDPECVVSATVEAALIPLVSRYPAIRFVRVNCDDIEFDSAAVPAVLAYTNQGELFANLTGLVDMIPEDEDFCTDSLKRLFEMHSILY